MPNVKRPKGQLKTAVSKVRLLELSLLDAQTFIFIYSKTYYIRGYTNWLQMHGPQEGGLDTGVGTSSSI